MLLDTDCERAVFRAYVRGITTRHPTIVERRAPGAPTSDRDGPGLPVARLRYTATPDKVFDCRALQHFSYRPSGAG
ncbi:hypothetical protein ACFQZK_13075 [Rhodococcus aetherivorans]